MNSKYVITRFEKDQYNSTSGMSDNLSFIWNDLIKKLPLNLQQEASSKKSQLVMHDLNERNAEGRFYHNLKFVIQNASEELKNLLEEMDDNLIVCLRDL